MRESRDSPTLLRQASAMTEATLPKSGPVIDAQMIREPDESESPRQGQQAFFLVHKPKDS
ncbi:hypothetical protein ACIA8E_13105 [Streptomyces sp. NPDC051664]|uniref:hypothetical protein n=1 Tax=Streptomyces sp. NPDC051664 TaxID=3365668 RepID=UPI0037930EB8